MGWHFRTPGSSSSEGRQYVHACFRGKRRHVVRTNPIHEESGDANESGELALAILGELGAELTSRHSILVGKLFGTDTSSFGYGSEVAYFNHLSTYCTHGAIRLEEPLVVDAVTGLLDPHGAAPTICDLVVACAVPHHPHEVNL